MNVRQFLEFLEATTRRGAIRTLESLGRIELAAQGGALLERVTTTRTSKSGVATTTVRERYSARPDCACRWLVSGAAASDGLVSAHRRGHDLLGHVAIRLAVS